uniref:Uncharacterized protein n=1 Tax=Spongospora subterranea TaxID=70186 RepID=A0A0H5R3Q7_9EUKA|eukprot:CRZ08778.1 hypothetical protein [Spongospora subterranea]
MPPAAITSLLYAYMIGVITGIQCAAVTLNEITVSEHDEVLVVDNLKAASSDTSSEDFEKFLKICKQTSLASFNVADWEKCILHDDPSSQDIHSFIQTFVEVVLFLNRANVGWLFVVEARECLSKIYLTRTAESSYRTPKLFNFRNSKLLRTILGSLSSIICMVDFYVRTAMGSISIQYPAFPTCVGSLFKLVALRSFKAPDPKTVEEPVSAPEEKPEPRDPLNERNPLTLDPLKELSPLTPSEPQSVNGREQVEPATQELPELDSRMCGVTIEPITHSEDKNNKSVFLFCGLFVPAIIVLLGSIRYLRRASSSRASVSLDSDSTLQLQ